MWPQRDTSALVKTASAEFSYIPVFDHRCPECRSTEQLWQSIDYWLFVSQRTNFKLIIFHSTSIFFFYHVYSPGATAVSEKSILWISVSRLLFSHSCCKTFPQLSGLIMGYCLHLVCYRRLWHQPRSDVTFES